MLQVERTFFIDVQTILQATDEILGFRIFTTATFATRWKMLLTIDFKTVNIVLSQTFNQW